MTLEPEITSDAPWRPVGTLATNGGFESDQAELAEAVRRTMAALATLSPVIIRSWKILSEGLRANHAVFMMFLYGEEYPAHRRRCRACNPAGFPRALRVDGNEYRRRTRRRNRR